MAYILRDSDSLQIPVQVISGFKNYWTWNSYLTYGIAYASTNVTPFAMDSDNSFPGTFLNTSVTTIQAGLISGGEYSAINPHIAKGIGIRYSTGASRFYLDVGGESDWHTGADLIRTNGTMSVIFDPDAVQIFIAYSFSSSQPTTADSCIMFSPWFNGYINLFDITSETDPYANLPISGDEEISGGGSGTVSIPGFPGLSATSTGIIGLFAPSASQMQALASFMWTDFGGTGTTTEDILKEIVEALKRSISNPLDYVVGLNIIPSQGLSIGASQTIQFGFVSSNVSMPTLSSQYFTVDCGSITFDPLCGNTFLDYAPYSKFSIYLPYIGVKDLDANDCVGHTIGVVYHGDTVTGGVTAYITKDGSVMYQYSGCCALNVPLSSDNWGSTISGAVQIATSMVTGGLSAGAAGVGAAAAQGAANVAANPSLLSPQVQHSGAVSGGAGCMGVQYPFIIREAVRFHSTAGFNKIAGYPSFYKRKLENVSGYTTVVDVHLDNVPATKPEIDEIIELLKGGVYL